MADDRNQDFRLRGIPNQYQTTANVRELVKRVLSIDPGASIFVHSLAINPIEQNSKVATLSFHTLPASLSNYSRTEWVFNLPEDETSDEHDFSRRKSLVFDTHFSGFTPLQHTKNDNYHVDIIALSGLGGHAFGSFKERRGSFMWLRDALPLDVTSARILIYGYDTRIIRSSSFQNLTNLGKALQIDMKGVRAFNQCRPIIFIGHSLGGLVIKEAIVRLKEDSDEEDILILNAISGFLFFSVPHQGMAVESLIPLIKDYPNRSLLESLNKNSALLHRLEKEFSNAFGVKHIRIISFYETETSPTAVKMEDGKWELSGPPEILVDVSSATCGSKYQYPINRNHSELVKFRSGYDEFYRRVQTALRPLVARLPSQSGILEAQVGRSAVVSLPEENLEPLRSLSFQVPEYRQKTAFLPPSGHTIDNTSNLGKASDKTDISWMKAPVNEIKKKRITNLKGSMVISIDFGTTYSSSAWATPTDFETDQINLITTWPGNGCEEFRVPTELFYEDGEVMWGYDIPCDADPVRWFSLLLLREEDIASAIKDSEFLHQGRRMLRETGKSATDLVADYLRAFWGHIITTIYKAQGASIIDDLAFHVVITMPTTWKDYAHRAMKRAVKKAGILRWRRAGPTTLSLAPDLEAAALATLCEPRRKVELGDVYVICDADDMAVKVISYEVTDLDPIKLSEAVVGTGCLCGNNSIDKAFETICRNRLGRQWNNLSRTSIRDIMSQWRYNIKPQFIPRKNIDERESIVMVPVEAFRHSGAMNDESEKPYIKNGRIHFQSSNLQEAFANSFAETKNLIERQIDKAKNKKLSTTGIILVRRPGSSPYLYQFLESKFEKAGIEVLQFTDRMGLSVICHGAILMGFLNSPTVEAISKALP